MYGNSLVMPRVDISIVRQVVCPYVALLLRNPVNFKFFLKIGPSKTVVL